MPATNNKVLVIVVKKYSLGVTLIELMIVIAIAAILLAVAAPSFRSTIVRSNLETLQDQFASAVITARTEAASRGEVVKVCALNSAGTAAACASTDWNAGWVVVGDGGTELMTLENKPQYPVAVVDDSAAAHAAVEFDARGYMVSSQRIVFGVCEKTISPEYKRGVAVEPSGRSYFIRGQYSKEDAVSFHEGKDNGTADTSANEDVKCKI